MSPTNVTQPSKRDTALETKQWGMNSNKWLCYESQSGCHPTELNHQNPCDSICSNIWSIDRCLVPHHSCSCVCPPGYEGQQCELNPDDCEDNDCENNSTCVDGINNYTCVCPPNYRGTRSPSLNQPINTFRLFDTIFLVIFPSLPVSVVPQWGHFAGQAVPVAFISSSHNWGG